MRLTELIHARRGVSNRHVTNGSCCYETVSRTEFISSTTAISFDWCRQKQELKWQNMKPSNFSLGWTRSHTKQERTIQREEIELSWLLSKLNPTESHSDNYLFHSYITELAIQLFHLAALLLPTFSIFSSFIGMFTSKPINTVGNIFWCNVKGCWVRMGWSQAWILNYLDCLLTVSS